jgi:hypothetical protein
MARTRFIGLAAATTWVLLSAAGPASADGLARFEKSIKPQIPPDTFTYKNAKGLGDNGFVLSDVVITTPPNDPSQKPEPISIKTITVEDLDFDAIEKQQPPLFAKLRLEGIASGSNAGGFDLKQMAGLDKVSADFLLDYKLVPDKKTFTLSKLELDLSGLARLETSMVLDGISPDVATQPSSAMDNASLRTATITYDDRSLLAKAIPVAAALQGSDAKSLIAMAVGTLDSFRADQGPPAQKAIDSLVAFVEDYQKPKGPLRVALNPPSKMSGTELSSAKSADEIVKALGIEVSYSGTRSSKPGEAAAAGGAVGPGAKNVPGKDDDDGDKDNKTLDKKK